MKRFDVAVIGAGPAGCSSAVFLACKGYSVALLEKQQFPREKLCGDFLSPANWEIFEKLGWSIEFVKRILGENFPLVIVQEANRIAAS